MSILTGIKKAQMDRTDEFEGMKSGLETNNSVLNNTGEIPPQAMQIIKQEEINEETLEENPMDLFDEQYLNSINDSVKSLSPDKIRQRDQNVIDELTKRGMGGLNMSIFSSATDVINVMQAKNGVKMRSNKQEIGSGRYVNKDPSKMSLKDYNEIAEKNKSLANIAIEAGITNVTELNKSVDFGNRLLNTSSGLV